MRKLERDQSYFGFRDGFDDQLEELSKYCFIADVSTNEREQYFFNGIHKYENTFLIDKVLKKALEEKKFDEKRILFFQDTVDLRHYFFYLERELSIVIIKSLTQQGRDNLDFINSTLKNRFADAVNETDQEVRQRLGALVTEKEKMELTNIAEDSYINFIKNSFLSFLKDMTSLPLISVRSTIIFESDNYSDIRKFIFDNLTLTIDARKSKIKNEIEKYESHLKRNKILFKRRYFQNLIEAHLNNYEYTTAIEKWRAEGGPPQIIPLLKYADNLFVNPPNGFRWEMSVDLMEPINLKNSLLSGFENFENIRNEKVFLEIKRRLSKAQIFLKKKDYSNFVGTLQKFMEGHLEAIGANKTTNKKGKEIYITKISQKVEHALRLCQNETEDSLNRQIVKSFAICFDKNPSAKIKKINPNFTPVNYPRNDLQHSDIGLNEQAFNKRLQYLLEEELGEETDTGHFQKYVRWFQLPEENIFDQINNRILNLLRKPDLLFHDENQEHE